MSQIISLPLRFPSTTHSTGDAHAFAIAQTNDEAYLSLLINSLNIEYATFKLNDTLIFDSSISLKYDGSLNYKETERPIFASINEMILYIEKTLISQNYVVFDVDVSKISRYNLESRDVHLHSILISGLNKEQNLICGSDYFDFLHYQTDWIEIHELFEAYLIVQDYILREPAIKGTDDWIRETSVISISTSPISDYSSILKKEIENYLQPTNFIFEDSKKVSGYLFVLNRINGNSNVLPFQISGGEGIGIYDFILDMFNLDVIFQKDNLLKGLSILKNHIQILVEILSNSKLNIGKYDIEKGKELLQKANTALYLFVKLTLSKEATYELIREKIIEIRSDEKDFLTEIVGKLQFK